MRKTLPNWAVAAGLFLVALPATLAAQQATTVSGRVVGEGGAPVTAATVSIAAHNVGTVTDAEGRYSFVVPAGRTGPATLTARRIGLTPATAQIVLGAGPVVQNFTLAAAATQLEGVVVTALGIEREKATLGTAQQQLSSEDLNQTRAQNVMQQMQGKVSGVQITGAGTQGGSSNIVIRGQNSITGNNQPLWVVDGMPISSTSRGTTASGGYDFGSVVSDINPDDIESMSVLKGPNAAALYGSRAANGVIVITTKKGRDTNGRIRMELNSTYTAERPSKIYDFQNQYGQGASGEFAFVDGAGGGVNDFADQSWGPKLDNRMTGCTYVAGTDPGDIGVGDPLPYDASAPCRQFTAPEGGLPWSAHPDNLKNYFNTGHTMATTLAVVGGTERLSARLSVGGENVEGIIPNNFFRKASGQLAGTLNINSQWSTNATLQYVRNSAVNRPGGGYNVSPLEQFIWYGRQVDIEALRNWEQGGATNGGPSNREFNWNYNYHNNPFFLSYGNPLSDSRDRFIGQAAVTFKPVSWVNATVRTSSDIYRYSIDQRFGQGNLNYADPSYFGAFDFTDDYQNENNTEAIVNASREITPAVTVNAMVGGNIRQNYFSTNNVSTSGISSPGIYNPANAAIAPTTTSSLNRRKVNSAFGSAAATFNGWFTIEGTARNDWSSTLPAGNNSYFYPSVNASVVLTDALPGLRNNALSFMKLRGSWAQVGSDAAPYQLRATFNGRANQFNGLPQFTFDNVVPNGDLRPEITTSVEAGAEVSLFDGRMTLDGSWYDKTTKDQIFNVAISPSSGFTSRTVNAGSINNKGVEALLTIVPVAMQNGFRWSSTFNFTRNRSMVTELQEGITSIQLGRTWSTNVEARVGEPYGAIYGYSFLRDSATNALIVSPTTGRTARGPLQVLGNIQPDWVGGWMNQLSYKNYSLNVVLDTRQGGDIFSVTNMWSDYAGVSEASMKGREVEWNNPGYMVQGVVCGSGSTTATGTRAGHRVCPNATPNTRVITSEDYFQHVYPVVEPFIYDASWVKLRELRFGYEVPTSIAGRVGAESMSIALTGRNLITWTDVPMIDPEFSYTTGNNQGMEFGALPNPRTVGISVRLTP